MASRGGCGGSRYDPLGLRRGRLWRDADRRRGARAGELARDGDGRTRGRGSAAMKAQHQQLVLVLLALVAVLGARGRAHSALQEQRARSVERRGGEGGVSARRNRWTTEL